LNETAKWKIFSDLQIKHIHKINYTSTSFMVD